MRNMFSSALFRLVSDHIVLSATRLETLVWLVMGVLSVGTTSLWQLAPHIDTRAEVSSAYRRLARFFQHVRLDGSCFARLIVALLGLERIGAWDLALDRTNWKLGKTHINILMLGVLWRGVCVPLFWTVFSKAGNSSTAERTALLQKLQQTFPGQPLGSLMGDREFVGGAWISWLAKAGISFVLRLREDMHVFNDHHAPLPLAHIARNLRTGETMMLEGFWRVGQSAGHASTPVRIVIMRLKTNELLALATDKKPKTALARYRNRWKIETLFAALKTRGFNLEATHITAPEKLALLIGILALAAALAYKTGLWAIRHKPTPIKKHGYPAKSIFRRGIERLRKIHRNPQTDQAKQMLEKILNLKIPTKPLILNGT